MRDSIQKPLCTSSTSTDTGAAADDLRINSALSSRFSALSETAVLIRPGQHSDDTPQLLDKLYARISWHLMPLFLAVMVLNHVDRTNLAYACKCNHMGTHMKLIRNYVGHLGVLQQLVGLPSSRAPAPAA